MRRTDREALELAIEWQKARGADRREQLEHILARDGWEEAAKFCAYSAQMAALRLRPWQRPSAWASVGDGTAAGECWSECWRPDFRAFIPTRWRRCRRRRQMRKGSDVSGLIRCVIKYLFLQQQGTPAWHALHL
jgi:hypothetical protein